MPRAMADRALELLIDRNRAAALGRAGREHVIAHWSVDRMVQGYEDLIARIYKAKCRTSSVSPEKSMASEPLATTLK